MYLWVNMSFWSQTHLTRSSVSYSSVPLSFTLPQAIKLNLVSLSKAVTLCFIHTPALYILSTTLQYSNVNKSCQVRERFGFEWIACLLKKRAHIQARLDVCVKSADDAAKEPWDSLQRGLGYLAMWLNLSSTLTTNVLSAALCCRSCRSHCHRLLLSDAFLRIVHLHKRITLTGPYSCEISQAACPTVWMPVHLPVIMACSHCKPLLTLTNKPHRKSSFM